MHSEQTTAVGIRGMRGMSSMEKKLVGHSTAAAAAMLAAAKAPTTPSLNEFSCVCATGWTGPTCEISKCIRNVSFSLSLRSCDSLCALYLFANQRFAELNE